MHKMNRVLVNGTIGAAPGFLIALGPSLAQGLGLSTGDQSQMARIGVAVLFLGVMIGVLVSATGVVLRGAAAHDRTGWGALGMALGLAVGTALGVALAPVLGTGLWLFTAPAAMLTGGTIATRATGRPLSAHRDAGRGIRPRHA